MVDLNRLGVSVDSLAFPEYLQEALGRPEAVQPEINPVPQLETVRYLNGLSRSGERESWFGPPAEAEGIHGARRNQLLARFVGKASTGSFSSSSPEVHRLAGLLRERLERIAAVQKGRAGL